MGTLNMTKALTAIALASILAACAGPLHLTRPNTTQEDFARDKFDCAQIARATAPGGGFAFGSPAFVVGASIGNAIGTANNQRTVFAECMSARGYTQRT
jgi:hypothetical protein